METNVHATTCQYIDIEGRKNSHQSLISVPCLWYRDQETDTVYICGYPLKCIWRQTTGQDVIEMCARYNKHTAEKRLVYVSKAQANIIRKLARGPVWR